MRSTAASRATAAMSSRASASSEETERDSRKERSCISSSVAPEDPAGTSAASAGDVRAVVGRCVAPLSLARARRRRGHRAVHTPPLRQARRHAGGTRLLRLMHRAPRGVARGECRRVFFRCCVFFPVASRILNADFFNSRLNPDARPSHHRTPNGFFFSPLDAFSFGVSGHESRPIATRLRHRPRRGERGHACRDAVVPRPRAR